MRLPKTLSSKLLTPAVESIVGQFLALARDYPLKRRPVDLERIIRTNPAVSAASEIRTVLLPLLMMGDYTHPNPTIEDEVRRELVALKGSWRAAVAKMGSYQNYGFSYTEVAYRVTMAGCGLSQMRTLNPQYTNFWGTMGNIKTVIYSAPQQMATSGAWVEIPYESGIHLVNQEYFTLGYDPKGIALLDRVAPYVDVFNIMMAALSLASNRVATPLLVGKTNTSAQQMVTDSDGQPQLDPITGTPLLINAGEKFKQELEQAENGSVLVIDLMDELAEVAQSQRGGEVITAGLDFILQQIMMCFLVPQTSIGMSASGVGDSGLSEQHQQMLLMAVRSDLEVITEGLIESLLRPMIEWNHGILDSYGEFPIVPPKNSAQITALLAIVPSLITSTVLDPKDADLIAAVKADLGL